MTFAPLPPGAPRRPVATVVVVPRLPAFLREIGTVAKALELPSP
jgi:hypothetical protein